MTFIPDLKYPVDPHPTWHVLDNSKLDCYRRCPRCFLYKYVFGWGSLGKNVNLIWGEGVHRMLGHCYRNGWDENIMKEAVELAVSYYREFFSPMEDIEYAPKTATKFGQVLQDYYNEYVEQDTLTTLHTEIAFRVRLRRGDIIAGRMDWTVQQRDTSLMVIDWKSSYRMPGEKGTNQWQISGQLGTYLYALRRKYPDHEISQAMISLIVPYMPNKRTGKQKKTGLLRIPVILSNDQLDLWEKETEVWIDRITEDYQKLSEAGQGKDVQCFVRDGTSCFDFGRLCSYFDQCSIWLNPLDHIAEGLPEGKQQAYWDPTREKAEEVWDLT